MQFNICIHLGMTNKWWKWRPRFFWRKNEPSGVIDANIDWLCGWVFIVLRPNGLPKHRLSVTREPSFRVTFWNGQIISP